MSRYHGAATTKGAVSMILIVEGTDGVGKTTFAKWWAARTGAIYLHAGPPAKDHPWTEYIDTLEPGRDYVLDRWHVGEMIWPGLFGRTGLFEEHPKMYRRIEEKLADLGGQLVFIHRHSVDIETTLRARGEAEIDIKRALLAQGLYVFLFSKLRPRIPFSMIDSDVIHQMIVDVNLAG